MLAWGIPARVLNRTATEPHPVRPGCVTTTGARTRPPAWTLILLGWLSGAALLSRADEPADPPRQAADCTLEAAPLPSPAPSPRAWRTVPGVGRARALALARAVWEAGVRDPRVLDLTRVPGVGEVTAARARDWLARRR